MSGLLFPAFLSLILPFQAISTAGDTFPNIFQNQRQGGVITLPAEDEKNKKKQPIISESGLMFGSGELREVLGLAADPSGYLYAVDAMTGKIFRFSGDGSVIEFENPPLDTAIYPIDIASFGTIVYVLDYTTNRVLRYDYRGAYLDILISFREYGTLRPVSLTLGGGGRFVTTDIDNSSITVFSPLLDIEIEIGGYGVGEGVFDRPAKAAILPDERIAVVETGNRRLQLFSAAGRYEKTIPAPGGARFVVPRSICADADGNIFVADARAGAVFVFSCDGEYLLTIDSYGGKAISPSAVSAGWNNILYVADLGTRSILLYNLAYPEK